MSRIAISGKKLLAITAAGMAVLTALAGPAQAAGTGRENAVVVSNPDLARAMASRSEAKASAGGVGTSAIGAGPYEIYLSGVRVLISFAEQWLDRGGVWEFGSSKLTMQWDGNLVIYNRYTNTVKWSPNIANQGGVRMLFQEDGNLVVYRSNGTVVWATNKFCDRRGDSAAVGLQDDGNFVAYCGYILAGLPAFYSVWAAGTNHA